MHVAILILRVVFVGTQTWINSNFHSIFIKKSIDGLYVFLIGRKISLILASIQFDERMH